MTNQIKNHSPQTKPSSTLKRRETTIVNRQDKTADNIKNRIGKFKTKAQMNWEIGKEAQDNFIREQISNEWKEETQNLFAQIRQNDILSHPKGWSILTEKQR